MSAVDVVTPTVSLPATGAAAAAAAGAQQSIDYMSLLLAQLKNQDPSSPMDATQMVAQTTQLGMLQQLTQLQADTSQTLTLQMRSTAAALVGRTVDYKAADGILASGMVDGVTFGVSTPTVTIGGVSISLDSVLGIASAAATSAATAPPSPDTSSSGTADG
jgi:flagellar basal-body rod modification protein FlgD